MTQISNILLVGSLFIGYSVARPVETEEVALYDRRAGEIRRKIDKLSDEERENLKQGFSVAFDRTLSADEKYARILSLPGVSENLNEKSARALKDTLTKINQLMYYYDKELLPTTTPKAKIRSLFKIIEEMMRNPIEFFEMTRQEQNGKLMSHLENMQVNDVFNFNNIMSKLLMKAHELGLGDFSEHLNRLMSMNYEAYQQ